MRSRAGEKQAIMRYTIRRGVLYFTPDAPNSTPYALQSPMRVRMHPCIIYPRKNKSNTHARTHVLHEIAFREPQYLANRKTTRNYKKVPTEYPCLKKKQMGMKLIVSTVISGRFGYTPNVPSFHDNIVVGKI